MLDSCNARWIQRGSMKCLAVADAPGTLELYHQNAIFARPQSQQLSRSAVERTLTCCGRHKLADGSIQLTRTIPISLELL
jgi:hypothetical protein